MVEAFKAFIAANNLLKETDRLLIAVSGGVDSVVLVHLCMHLKNPLVLAHCNFNLRGEESDADEQFIRTLAERLQLPLVVKHFDTEKLAESSKSGIQEQARILRYNWFKELTGPAVHSADATQPVADLILTAHHADDNLETLMMFFFRGTGINGLGGMEPRKENLVRPILFARKKELRQYAASQGIAFREDSSNLSDKYTRNYFRHAVMPVLKDIYPSVETNLIGNIQRFRDAATLYQLQIAAIRKKLLTQQGENHLIPILLLEQQPALATVVYELLAPFGFLSSQVPDILSLLDAATGKQVLSPDFRVIRNRKWLVIAPAAQNLATVIVWEEDALHTSYPFGQLEKALMSIEAGFQAPDSQDLVYLDAKSITYPLVLRQWKQGDYFYPLGLGKKKKISKFLIDKKLSLAEKDQVFVLESGGRIIWVLGYRIDHRYRLMPGTEQALRLRLLSSLKK